MYTYFSMDDRVVYGWKVAFIKYRGGKVPTQVGYLNLESMMSSIGRRYG